MELEIEHIELMLKIDEGCSKNSAFRIPPVGTPTQQLEKFQKDFQITIELEEAGYIEWTCKPNRESQTGRRLYAFCLVKGLTALGRRVLKDPKLKQRMNKRLREQVLLALYESKERPTHDEITEEHQVDSEKMLNILDHLEGQGLIKSETMDDGYGLTVAGISEVERLIEGTLEISIPPAPLVFINHGQVGAMGTSPHMEGGTFQQWNQGESVDAQVLAKELSLLREWLESDTDDPQRADDVDAVALAHNAARRGQVRQALKALSNVSQWLVDAATQVGASLIVELLNQRSGK